MQISVWLAGLGPYKCEMSSSWKSSLFGAVIQWVFPHFSFSKISLIPYVLFLIEVNISFLCYNSCVLFVLLQVSHIHWCVGPFIFLFCRYNLSMGWKKESIKGILVVVLTSLTSMCGGQITSPAHVWSFFGNNGKYLDPFNDDMSNDIFGVYIKTFECTFENTFEYNFKDYHKNTYHDNRGSILYLPQPYSFLRG